jgi:hypothetical protein
MASTRTGFSTSLQSRQVKLTVKDICKGLSQNIFPTQMKEVKMSPDSGIAGFAGFIPLIITGVFLGIAAYSIGKRKGKNRLVCFLLCLIPPFNVFYLFYLVSLTDKNVIERLDYLENRLKVSKGTFSGAESVLME